MKNAIYPLFPYPIMVCAKNYEFTGSEKEYIAELEMIENIGNSMSRNDKILESEELADLKRFIDEQIFIFKKKLLHIKDENEIYITQSWVNTSAASQYHPKHKHPNSVISGVMYLDENADESLPPIRFHRTMEMFPLEFAYDDLNEFTASCRLFETVQGRLMLFPSLLEHDVEKNESDRVRTSISFNTYVRGIVGGREQLTEVNIS
jgi:uncharacterized protein (TIGR02466 family)